MQDNCCCYTLAIRQICCQNSISRCIDNVYTNITVGSSISLNFGYNVTITNTNCNSVTIKLTNNNFIPDLIFNIPNNSYKIFDLPQESGTLRVFIGARQTCCPISCANCNNC